MIDLMGSRQIVWSEPNKVRIKIAILGLCISLITFSMESVINRDGILYLQTAQVFEESGFAASFKAYRWPFYSIAIAVFHSITTLSYEYSAHFLNTFFLLLLVDAFVRIYWEVNPNVNYLWMPAVIILAYTGLNDYRPMIIRGWGYWAFLFQALLYFIKASKYEKLEYYILWQIFIVLAFLFRVEAIVFMLFLPLFCLLKKRAIVPFVYSVFFLLLPISIMLFLILTGYKGTRVSDILSYIDVFSYLDYFSKYAHNVAKYGLNHHAESNAILFAVSGLLGVMIFNTIVKTGALYIAVVVIGLYRYKRVKNSQYFFISLMIGISFITFFIYFCRSRAIAGRYVIQITLFFLLYVTYYSELILDEIRSMGRPVLVCLFGGGVLINLAVGLHHSTSHKFYIKTMGEWVKNHISESAWMTTNDRRLYYYSGGILKNNMTWAQPLSLKNNEYVLLKIEEGDKQYDKLIDKGQLKIVHSVVGPSKDKAVLFKIINP